MDAAPAAALEEASTTGRHVQAKSKVGGWEGLLAKAPPRPAGKTDPMDREPTAVAEGSSDTKARVPDGKRALPPASRWADLFREARPSGEVALTGSVEISRPSQIFRVSESQVAKTRGQQSMIISSSAHGESRTEAPKSTMLDSSVVGDTAPTDSAKAASEDCGEQII